MREPLQDDVAALYAALTEEDCWRTVLAGLCARLKASGMSVLFGDGDTGSAVGSGVPMAETAGIRDWLSEPAPERFAREEVSPIGDCGCWRVRGVASDDSAAGRHCVVRLDHGGKAVGYADLYREPGVTDFEPEVMEAFCRLAPLLAQALALAIRLAKAEISVRRCSQCSDMRPFGCVLLGTDGAVMDMNPAAAEMLDADDGLLLSGGGLHAQRGADDAKLGSRLAEVLTAKQAPSAAFVSVPRASGRRPYVVFMGRLNATRSAFAGRVPGVRLVIVDTDRANLVSREVLRAVYELTEAESWVAWHLVNGDTPKRAAQRLGIAHNTLRHHLERVFAKTGARRQSDLIRLLQAPFLTVGSMN